MKKNILFLLMTLPCLASNFEEDIRFGFIFNNTNKNTTSHEQSSEKIHQRIKNIYENTISKIKYEDKCLFNSDELLKYLKYIFLNDMRNHQDLFLKVFKFQLSNDSRIKNKIKFIIATDILENLSISSSVNNVGQFYKKKYPEDILLNKIVHDKKSLPNDIPLDKQDISEDIITDDDSSSSEIIIDSETLLNDIKSKNKKKPIKRKAKKKIVKKYGKKNIATSHKKKKKVPTKRGKSFAQKKLKSFNNDNFSKLTLEQLRTEILLGYNTYDFFYDFAPDTRNDQNDLDYFKDLVENYHDEIDDAEDLIIDGIYVNKGFKNQIYTALYLLEKFNNKQQKIPRNIVLKTNFLQF